MNNYELLSVKEFANLAGVSVQSIYKGMNGRLSPWVELVDNRKMLNAHALEELYGIKIEQHVNSNFRNQSTSNTDSEVEFLRAQIESLQTELAKEREHNRIKDKQLLDTLNKLADTQSALAAGNTAEKQKALAEKLIEGKNSTYEENQLMPKKTFFSRFFKTKRS